MKVLIVLCVVLAGAFAAQDCPANSHYNSCGSACPLTCKNFLNPPKVCVLMCVAGCHCDEGYVKADDGSCVLPDQCEASADELVCGENQVYKQCGTACPLTCENYQNPPRICPAMCVSGCHCQPGYVKTQDGRCVRPQECVSEAVSEVCDLPLESGRCLAYMPRYGFDKTTGQCKKFIYGGCGGNGNNFRTLAECESACHAPAAEPVCGENQVYKQCGTACPLTCENYQNPPKICPLMCVSGCHCQSGYVKTQDGRCVRPEQCVSESVADVCELPLETGPCMALFHRYGYDKDTGKCREFVYGGCRGNGNNFKTLAECENACHEFESALIRPDCDKAPETGKCRAFSRRFYYDQEAGMCKKFVYGGCGGNRNNFETEFECYNKCGALYVSHASACQQDKEVGQCKAYLPRFFFNKHTGKCEEFIYGGCGGNSNNFNSLEDCEAVCY